MSAHAAWTHPALRLPAVRTPEAGEVSTHPLIIGASPGTTGTMSLYRALVLLGISAVHYSRQFNASSGIELDTYNEVPPGRPVPLLRPLFADSYPAPPVNLSAARSLDLRFLAATDALLDTPSSEVFFEVLASFPEARVIITARDPNDWAASRKARHPSDRMPLLPYLDIDAPMAAATKVQAASALALWHRVAAASVPPDRLLILDLFTTPDEDLWQQLCAFVRRPLPRDDDSKALHPFPHARYGDDVKRHVAATFPAGSP
jgi:hypothetical protein